jgi:osmotically inducible protein OsmC
MAAQREAEAHWEGDLPHGGGAVSLETGLARDLPVSWASRTERPDHKTSPEELLAAAHASCYAMALANTLAKAGATPERLDVKAKATFDKVGDAWAVTRMELAVSGRVPGANAASFEDAARKASQSCPISRALQNNVEIRVQAQLA